MCHALGVNWRKTPPRSPRPSASARCHGANGCWALREGGGGRGGGIGEKGVGVARGRAARAWAPPLDARSSWGALSNWEGIVYTIIVCGYSVHCILYIYTHQTLYTHPSKGLYNTIIQCVIRTYVYTARGAVTISSPVCWEKERERAS